MFSSCLISGSGLEPTSSSFLPVDQRCPRRKRGRFTAPKRQVRVLFSARQSHHQDCADWTSSQDLPLTVGHLWKLLYVVSSRYSSRMEVQRKGGFSTLRINESVQ